MACLEQWKTEELLEGRLAELGAMVERETELAGIDERLDGVRATLRCADGSEEVTDTPWLVACDGAHSTVRHLNRQQFPGETDPRRYIIADVATEAPFPRNEIFFFICEAGFLGWGPLPEQRSLLFANFDDNADRNAEPPTLTDLQALVDARSPQKAKVSDPRWIGWYWTNYRLTPHYRHGRTLLAGDAAHIHSSVGAQGMNTGIQDAYNLGWKLALVSQGQAPESLLDSYEKERHAIARDVLDTTKAMADRVLSYGQYPEDERDRLYRHAHVPEAKRLKAITHIAELDLDYRKSPICIEYRHSHETDDGMPKGPHAGAEALDAGPLQVDGQTLSLFDLISGPLHTLLLFADEDGHGRRHSNAVHLAVEVARVYGDLIQVYMVLPDGADGTAFEGVPARLVRDREGAMRARYDGHPGRSYLIRPDGYIGWCSDRPSLPALRDYLARVFVCA